MKAKKGGEPGPAGWQDSVDKFLAHLGRSEASAHTTGGYRETLSYFAAWWRAANPGEELTPGAITDHDLREWRDALKLEPIKAGGAKGRARKPATINTRLAALKSFLRWCWNAKLISSLPESPRREKLGTRAVKALDKREQGQLLRHAARDRNQRNPAFVQVFLGTGLRVAELVALRREDVDLGERKGQVEVRKGKGCKPRSIPIGPETREAFRAAFALGDGDTPDAPVFFSQIGDGKGRGGRRPLTEKGIRLVLARYARELGWKDGLSPHRLRHTFAINLRDRQAKDGGINWPVIASLLGHSSVVTTMDHYGRPSERDRRLALDPGADDD